ncbi:glycoside hydrolase family 97 catalytic domain-containing protein [Catellatospora sp. NPDC049609]|uniref:glycoside hydrolase family 97 catalytic domain-containing protein n=1 Tax=Catellatospora sp. NPDC049609 TaxID=3155505 RepID=UPI003428CF38
MIRRRLRTCVALLTALAASATAVALTPTAAAAAVTWTVTGPSGVIAAQVTLDGGVLSFGASSRGSAVLLPSPIGIETAAADLTRNLVFTARTDQTVTESYTMPTGKKRSRQTTYAQATLSFTGTAGARLDVVVRVSDAGAAYRYVLPGSGPVTVRREASSWTLPASAPAWLVPPHIEDQGVWFETTAGGAASDSYGVPALFDVGGVFALLAESDLDGRYASSALSHQAGSGAYTTSITAAPVTATLPLATPWRTAAIGDLRTVTESTIVDDLSAPARFTDTSWVKPGTVAWSWLTEHASPGDAARQRQYVDFAQRNGWSYVLIDEGWQSSWLPGVVSYARDRGVGVIVWFNSAALQTAQQREAWLPLVKSWGVAGVKIDFSYQFTQPTLKWYDAVLARTAELKLMANFHGSATPRGMQRTWPHVMTAEAVFGAEQQQNRAALNTILPFTRNVIASMDFTPVTFSVNRDTTDAHELATAVVFESGWQHDADNPAGYEARPEALRFLNQLPAAWDETRLLGGRPNREAYVARRNGTRWYVGGISALAAKTYQTPLTFLGTGQWLAETVRDGSGGLLRELRVVTSTATLSVPLATRGGFATVLCPYTAGMLSCGAGDPGGILKGQESGICADVPNNSQTNGTAVTLFDCHGGANQRWTVNPAGQLVVYGTRCLTAAGTTDGSAVQINDCGTATTRQWTVGGDGSVVNAASGKCLDAYANGTANGTALIVWTCNGGANQKWHRNSTPASLKGVASARCVDVPNSNQANGTRPALWDCHRATNQTWTSTPGNQLRVFDGKCLEAAGGATADGTAVQIFDCNGSTAQQWRVRSNGWVVGVGSGKCLDAYDNGTANGTQLIIWPCGPGTNQKWNRT